MTEEKQKYTDEEKKGLMCGANEDYILGVDAAVLGYDGIAATCAISFGIKSGDFLCIVGDNGAGKSTLVKAILGLLKPMSGQIFLFTQNKKLGYLPQQNDIQKDFPATSQEIVLSGTFAMSKWYKPFYTKAQKECVDWAFDMTNSEDLKKKCYRELSGGQQQRVLLARALASSKSMIVLDEPTANLDPAASSDFFDLLKQINDRQNMTIVVVSHDHAQALRYATHILHLSKDKAVFETAQKNIEEAQS